MIAFRVCHVHYEEDQFQRDLQVCGFHCWYLSIKNSLGLFHSMVLMYANK